jgi:hypothetical protein
MDAPLTVRDSAGVEIVSTTGSGVGDSGCPRVDPMPSLRIGGQDAQGPYDLRFVIGARRLPGGGVVALDGATFELRFFDAVGRHLRTTGRRGAGPGEFRNPGAPRWFGHDTLIVYDTWTACATLVDATGLVLKSVSLAGIAGGGQVRGRLADGSLLLTETRGVRQGTEPGIRRDPAFLVRLSAAGALLDTLGAFPGPSVAVEVDGGRTAMTAPPFPRNTYFALGGDRVFVADNADYRVLVYRDGRLERIIERRVRPVPITASDVAREKAWRAGSGRDRSWKAWLDRLYRRENVPATFPVFSGIQADAEGWLWVRAYAPTDGGEYAWDVFDDRGHLRCSLALPPGLQPREIGTDYIIGVASDSLGVEQLRLHRLHREVRGDSS